MQQKFILPFLFINLNILSILDKFITILALKSPEISERNIIISSLINNYGVTFSLISYMLFAFIWTVLIYVTVIKYRAALEKNSMNPEYCFILLNILFYFVLANNIFQILKAGGA